MEKNTSGVFTHFKKDVQDRPEHLHVAIPEVDYPRIATLDGCVDYVAGRLFDRPDR